MKKRLWTSWIIVIILCIYLFVFHDNKWNESLLNQEEKINYSEYIDLSTSEIKTSIIQKALSDNWILKTWNNLYYNKDLDRITKLAIELPKNSVKELDLSELKYLRNLKSLNIYWKYEFIQTQEWNRESVWSVARDWYLDITWLENLSWLTTLQMHDFPLKTLDWEKLPPNLKTFDFSAMWLENLVNDCEMVKIPNLSVMIDWKLYHNSECRK
jgi:Leucine-rich repeat (LRR) protein